ncbi:MAG: cob(I)yrinic acid a,c-diamide adenosyltransferase [Gammaproteobacteria bacterium]|nr:cob(I)yrinic acid a,c-diamide adenosyltransferase [Gammaproteobacteria bacterium]
MKIYTRRGDEGDTGLLGGGRVAKDHPRLHAYGTVDELSSCLGLARGQTGVPATAARLVRIQRDLFAIGASLALAPAAEGRKRPPVPEVPVDRIGEMEAWMDEADADLPPLRNFILAGGAPAAATLHLARSVCRRAERVAVALAAAEAVDEGILPYLNRLSDLLFVLARLENHAAGVSDETWEK